MPLGPWTGEYVRRTLGLAINSHVDDSLFAVEDLIGLALRRNPKRAHLLVSRVLGKHIPSNPGLLIAAGELLGVLAGRALVAEVSPATEDESLRAIAGHINAALEEAPGSAAAELHSNQARAFLTTLKTSNPCIPTVGYAETATGLGKLVANTLGSYYIHSTRHAGEDHLSFGDFEEEHSHATSHRVLPRDQTKLTNDQPLVLVDDELSTGKTIINTIRNLHKKAPRSRYVVAVLVDMRGAADLELFAQFSSQLNILIDVVSLAHGTVTLPEDVMLKASHILQLMPTPTEPKPEIPGTVEFLQLEVPADAPYNSRYGTNNALSTPLIAAISHQISLTLPSADHAQVLVLGTEEFLHTPLEVADFLNSRVLRGSGVVFSSSTRSPIAASNDPEYAIKSVLGFSSHDTTVDGPGPRFAYNISTSGQKYAAIVVMPEPGTDSALLTGPGSITEALAKVSDKVVVALLPSPSTVVYEPLVSPGFGSYGRGEVSWLLKDLSTVSLEEPTDQREQKIQDGIAHYSDSLPIEYQPSEQYLELFDSSLEQSAKRVALAIGVVSELTMAKRNEEPVLVSLARAGTPIGVLMKRWISKFHKINVPHYTMSIVRGKGIDEVALHYLASRFDPRRIMFVDGWTGKGAITRELKSALTEFAQRTGLVFSPELAVLADPGHCTTIYGTRDDFLIPSACLNSTVSGLVSRTVLNASLIGPGEFHGAKFYEELQVHDRSALFLEAVSAHFEGVRDEAIASAVLLENDTPDTPWTGWAAVEQIREEYGLTSPNMVKPGIGETTRVLLRRVPWKILVRPDSLAELEHILLLANQRGVEVEEIPDLPYSCVGLIAPSTSTTPTENEVTSK